MVEKQCGHFIKLPLNEIQELVDASPRVECSEEELISVLNDLHYAAEQKDYIQPTPTSDNPALSDD